jgi:hypothetical protein
MRVLIHVVYLNDDNVGGDGAVLVEGTDTFDIADAREYEAVYEALSSVEHRKVAESHA